MSLLKEIQDSAVDSQTDLTTVLRKCRILASKLGHHELKLWVVSELDGYKHADLLPVYRKISCQSIGHFFGAFGRELKNAPIPTQNIPEEYREIFTTAEFRGGISELAALVKNESIVESWPPEACQAFGSKFFVDWVLVEAHKTIPVSQVIGILDTVRNRVLNFALEIEAENPQAGEAVPGTIPIPEKIVSQI